MYYSFIPSFEQVKGGKRRRFTIPLEDLDQVGWSFECRGGAEQGEVVPFLIARKKTYGPPTYGPMPGGI